MKVRAFTKTYDKRRVLDFSGFDFEPGKIYAILGANGSGKSTFAKIISGIEACDDSKTVVSEESLGYMPQHSYAFRMTTLKNVMLSGADEDTALEALRKIGIEELADKKGNKLSGGETARMALARLLVKRFDTVVLDEPCASMDIKSIKLAEQMIKEYCKRESASVIMVTHSLSQARRIADEILFFHEGRLVDAGSEEVAEFLKFFD